MRCSLLELLSAIAWGCKHKWIRKHTERESSVCFIKPARLGISGSLYTSSLFLIFPKARANKHMHKQKGEHMLQRRRGWSCVLRLNLLPEPECDTNMRWSVAGTVQLWGSASAGGYTAATVQPRVQPGARKQEKARTRDNDAAHVGPISSSSIFSFAIVTLPALWSFPQAGH